ncbi:MAG: NYN domain-containing protein [Micrococcales bacterium]|nr:NYN domain-containing protein [Micrococcales bacterium]
MTEPAVAPNDRLAVLIDADNADPNLVEPLLAEISKYGTASVKRIYGDWTRPNLAKWKDSLLAHSIQPIQQFGYTSGKNATDSAMIIDAMDLLYTGTFDGFCIVSSDSDFTRLASRIRESGTRVLGFGEEKTPRPFVTACDQFVYTEIFRSAPADSAKRPAKKASSMLGQDAQLVGLFRSAIEAASGEDGWATLGAVGNIIVKQAPDFDPRRYGYSKLSDLTEAIGLFTVVRSDSGIRVADGKQKPPAKPASARRKLAVKS